jgi:hypothetical protein
MSRVQLALNVTDLDGAIEFYTRLFATEPAKVRPGYANFAVADPPLKLVLIEGPSAGGTLNHLGIEVGSTEEVAAAHRHLSALGMAAAVEDEVACCYAVQDKVWVAGPDAEPWEIYTVLADVEMPEGQLRVFEGTTADGDAADRDASGRDNADQDAADRDNADRDAAGRDAAGRDAAGRDAAGRDAAGRDAAGRETGGPGACCAATPQVAAVACCAVAIGA